jgi:hypothetical protein
MPTIFAANESSVLVEGKPVDGVRAITYRRQQARENVYALGSAERIGMISGPMVVEGQLRVASTSPDLDKLTGDASFHIIAQLKHGDAKLTVTFDECFLLEKSFDIEVGGHGETVYSFTATRVREDVG